MSLIKENPVYMVVDRTVKIKQKDGLSAAAYCLFYDATNRVTPFSVYKVIKLLLGDLAPVYLEKPSEYWFGFLDADQARHYAKEPDNDMSEEFVEDALAHGEECYAALDGDVLCNYGWYTSEPAHVRKDIYFAFDGTYKYMHKGFTDPRYRGKRLHAFGMALACKEYTERGFKGFLSLMEAHNLNARRVAYRLGYEDAGNIYIAMMFGRYRSYSDRTSRAYGCKFFPLTDGSRPTP